MSRAPRTEAPVSIAASGPLGRLEEPRERVRVAAAECEREWPVSAASRADPAIDELRSDLVREVQRMWILSAVARLACEKGPEALTVREIIARAGVSRRRFYELFENSRDCFEAAFEETIAKAGEQVLAACGKRGEWVERLRRGLLALLSFFDAEPELTRLCVLGSTATASPAMVVRRREILTSMAMFIEEGRHSVPGELQPPPLTAESLVGGALSVIQARMLEADPGPMVELLNPIVSVIVLAYRGPAAAHGELSRAVPPGADPAHGPDARNSVALDMRLTYRTLRVLAVIAGSPGISNRRVGEAAGIANAGQISKMLARLERHGLIRNTGEGQAKGAANAWTLTPVGARIDRARRLARGAQASQS